MSESAGPVYRAERSNAGWRVVGPGERVVVECRDAGTAGHYADLMRRAFQAGYRKGYARGAAGDEPDLSS